MKLNLEIKNMSTEYAKNNVVADIKKDVLKHENVINQDHVYNILHSTVFDCNPHTKVKYRNMEAISMVKQSVTTIFVPTTATEEIPKPKTQKVILDIRSFEGKGEKLLTIFRNFISDFSVRATSALGSNGRIYMSHEGISNKESSDPGKITKPPIRNVLVLVDRYTLCELDEYCVMLLAYFYKNYKVKGVPHNMHKFLFKPIRIGAEGKKINVSVPVLELKY